MIPESHFRKKTAAALALIVIGAVFIVMFLRNMQVFTLIERQQEINETAIEAIIERIEANWDNADELIRSYHKGNQAVLDDIDTLLSKGLSERVSFSDRSAASGAFADLLDRSGADMLMLMSGDGKIVLDADESAIGSDAVSAGLMTKQELGDLLKGTEDKDGAVTPVETESFGEAGSFYYYSRPCSIGGRDYLLVLGADATQLEKQLSSIRDVSRIFSQSSEGDSSFAFLIDKSDNSLLFYDSGKEDLTGKKLKDAGLSERLLEDGYEGIENISGSRYYCCSKVYNEGIVICIATKISSMFAGSEYLLFWSALSFVLIVVICLAYAVILRNDAVRRSAVTEKKVLRKKSSKPLYFNRTIFRKAFPLMLAGVLAMFGISFYVQSILDLSEAMDGTQRDIDAVSQGYRKNAASLDTVQGYYRDQLIAKAQLIAYLLETDPSALNADSDHYHFYYDDKGSKQYLKDAQGNRIRSVSSSEVLQELCETNDVESIYVYDEDGRTIGTNTPDWFNVISLDKDDPSYPFRDVLDGKAENCIRDLADDDGEGSTRYVGVGFDYYTRKDNSGKTVYVSRYDADGEVHRSMIMIGFDAEKAPELDDATSITYLLNSSSSQRLIKMYSLDGEHRCLYSGAKGDIGKTAEELDIPEKVFDFSTYCRIKNGDTYGDIRLYQESGGYMFEVFLYKWEVYLNRGIIALFTSLLTFIFILILCGKVLIKESREEELAAYEYWSRSRFRWLRGDPEEQLVRLVRSAAGLMVICVIITAAIADIAKERNSMFLLIADGAWNRGLNIFAFSKAALVILSVAFAVTLLRIPLRKFPSLFGSRGETIGHLLVSVLEYGGAIAALFYSLYLFGVDSSKLLAGAGLMTLVIGLGAQSLITDIISGIFIVFEGEFQVGDIVTINDHRGIVHDIGLRTTKVLGIDDAAGNLKVFNNSEIKEVLNMTYSPSWVLSTINIEYGQDVDYVEEVLRRELPKVGDNYPRILTGPNYLGVNDLGESGVELMFLCTCNERYTKPVKRVMNRGILKIFYENSITVPFTNVTVSQLDTSGRKTIEDLLKEDGTEQEGP